MGNRVELRLVKESRAVKVWCKFERSILLSGGGGSGNDGESGGERTEVVDNFIP
jgi:hypothetical protein